MRYASLFLIGTVVFSVSCSDDTETNPMSPDLPVAAAAAVTNEVWVNQPFETADWFLPCANGGVGELVRFSYLVTGNFHITINGNRMALHGNGVGRLRGKGLSTGANYQETFALQWNISGSLVNGQYSEVVINGNDVITAQGQGNIFLTHLTVRLTVNANGELTVALEKFTAECR